MQCMGEAGTGGCLSHPCHSSRTLPPEHTQIIPERARAEAGRALGECVGSGVGALGDSGAGGDLASRWVHAAVQLVGGAGSLTMQLLPPVPSAAEHTKAGRQRVRGERRAEDKELRDAWGPSGTCLRLCHPAAPSDGPAVPARPG